MNSAQVLARSSFLFLGLLVPLGGCGDYDGAPPASLPPEWSGFVSTLAQAHCATIAPCCAQAGLDSSACESSLRATLTSRLDQLTGKLGVAFDPAAGARLVEFVQRVNSACSIRRLAESGTIPWKRIFYGTIPEGATCQISDECQSSPKGTAVCAVSTYSTGASAGGSKVTIASSVCGYEPSTSPPHADLGQACSGTCKTAACTSGSVASEVPNCFASDGLFCAAGSCAAVASLGQACSAGMFCADGAYCEAGVCVATSATGACASEDQCLISSYCDQESKQCAPLKSKDAPCTSASECESGACQQNRCDFWSVASSSTCGGSAYSGEVR